MKKLIIAITMLALMLPIFAKTVPTVTVSILPEKYFVKAIAKRLVNVDVIVPKGSEPEDFSPTPQQLIQLKNSTLYFSIPQLPFEKTWMPKFKASNPDMTVVDVTQSVPLINGNPHIWLSIGNASIMAHTMYLTLCQKFPDHKEAFTKNYAELVENLTVLKHKLNTLLESHEGRSFIVYHPAFDYFAAEHKLTEIAIEQEGKDASAQRIVTIIGIAKEKNLHILFSQPQFNMNSIKTIAKEMKASVVILDPLNENWYENMLDIGSKIAFSYQ